MACVMASIPVAAVNLGGKETINVGSRMATSGARKRLPKSNFFDSTESFTIATIETSEPVPAVVGMAINGLSLSAKLFRSLILHELTAHGYANIGHLCSIENRTTAYCDNAVTAGIDCNSWRRY